MYVSSRGNFDSYFNVASEKFNELVLFGKLTLVSLDVVQRCEGFLHGDQLLEVGRPVVPPDVHVLQQHVRVHDLERVRLLAINRGLQDVVARLLAMRLKQSPLS